MNNQAPLYNYIVTMKYYLDDSLVAVPSLSVILTVTSVVNGLLKRSIIGGGGANLSIRCDDFSKYTVAATRC